MRTVWAAILGVLWAMAAAAGADTEGRAVTDGLAAEIVAREWSGLQPPTWVTGRPAARILPGDEVSAEARRLGDGATEPFGVEITVSEGLVERLCAADTANPASANSGAAAADGLQTEALAGVIAHELAHVVLGHHRGPGGGRQDDVIIGRGASREAELAADGLATQIAGRGGYDPRGLVWVLQRARESLGDNSYWDSLGGEHPSYTQRLAALESDRAELWQAALDFEVGVDLLGAEDYACAEMCFRGASSRFPDSPEVRCNLGYSLLMAYYRALPSEHWVRYDIGQPVPVGYATFLPVAPRQTRGEDEMARLRALWTEAVGCLRAAVQREPTYVLAQGNLGFAYLIAPDGPDAAEAAKWLAGADGGPHLRAATANGEPQAAVGNDRALAAMLGGDREGALGLLRPLAEEGRGGGSLALTAPAVNLCVLLGSSGSRTDQEQAADRLQELLPRIPAPSAQWEYAHERYVALCDALQRAPLPEARLLPARARQVTAHVTCGDAKLYLGTSLVGVVKALGSPDAVVPLGAGDGMSCWRYPKAGLELVFAQDRLVRAKVGRGATAAMELLRDGRPAGTLAGRDDAAKLDRLLPPFDGTVRLGDGKPYRYYAGARLAALVEADHVAALALVGGRP